MRTPSLVRIDGLSSDGQATGLDAKGRRWVVRGAQPGSLVRAAGRTKAGILLEVVEPAPDAEAPRCPQVDVCGGCTLQGVPLERQRAEKHAAVAALLAPLGGVDHGIRGAPAGFGYRNKVELAFGVKRYLPKDEMAAGAPMAGRFLGMHAPGRFDRIADAPRCELASDAMNAVLARVRADTLATDWPCWDPVARAGFWRHLVLREGQNGVLAAIYTSPGDEAQAAWLRAHAPGWGAAGVLWFENDRTADAAVGTLRQVLCGVDHVEERLGAVRYRLSPTAFFQVNPEGARILCETVAEAAGRGGPLVDLYCGTGALGLYLADRFDRVVGVDSNAASIDDARANAARNGIDATFVAGEVEAVVSGLDLPSRPTLIVDPPRAGLHPAALSFVAGRDARALVYVACRPSSLLRDGLKLIEAGWTCTDRWAVDLFPQTGHLEVVSRWERA